MSNTKGCIDCLYYSTKDKGCSKGQVVRFKYLAHVACDHFVNNVQHSWISGSSGTITWNDNSSSGTSTSLSGTFNQSYNKIQYVLNNKAEITDPIIEHKVYLRDKIVPAYDFDPYSVVIFVNGEELQDSKDFVVRSNERVVEFTKDIEIGTPITIYYNRKER